MLYIMYCTVTVDSLCQVNFFLAHHKPWPQGASQSVQYKSPSILRPLIQIRGKKQRKAPKKLQEEHQRWDSSPRTDRYSRDVMCTF